MIPSPLIRHITTIFSKIEPKSVHIIRHLSFMSKNMLICQTSLCLLSIFHFKYFPFSLCFGNNMYYAECQMCYKNDRVYLSAAQVCVSDRGSTTPPGFFPDLPGCRSNLFFP